jgi:hypothetical protein
MKFTALSLATFVASASAFGVSVSLLGMEDINHLRSGRGLEMNFF